MSCNHLLNGWKYRQNRNVLLGIQNCNSKDLLLGHIYKLPSAKCSDGLLGTFLNLVLAAGRLEKAFPELLLILSFNLVSVVLSV